MDEEHRKYHSGRYDDEPESGKKKKKKKVPRFKAPDLLDKIFSGTYYEDAGDSRRAGSYGETGKTKKRRYDKMIKKAGG